MSENMYKFVLMLHSHDLEYMMEYNYFYSKYTNKSLYSFLNVSLLRGYRYHFPWHFDGTCHWLAI
jgi:hypothetical protein